MVKMKNLSIFILIVSFSLITSVQSQEIALERISTKEGLSQNSITCIAQDSTGFLWFGTYDGLNRYDGYDFKIYRHDPRNPYSLNHNHIRSLCVDYMGNVWIGTVGGGLNVYDQEKEIFKSFIPEPENSTSLSYHSITSLLIDKQNNLWIGTSLGGVNKFSLTQFYSKNNSNRNIKFKRYLNKDIGVSDPNWNRITCLYEDGKGSIWIGTRYGLSRYDPESKKFKTFFSHKGDSHSLLDNNIAAITEDKYGNIWIGNWEHGLNKLSYKTQKFITFPFKENDSHSPSHNMIMCLYKNESGDIWIGTWGGGLNKLNTLYKNDANHPLNKKESFIHFKENPKDFYAIDNLSIYCIYQDRSGILWIGTDWNGLYKDVETNAKFKHYYSGLNQKISQNQFNIFDLIRDPHDKNKLWLATRHNGIAIFDVLNSNTYFYKNDPDDPSSVSHNKIRTFFKDRKGNLWIGTEIGLDRFDFKNKKFIHYTLDPDNPYAVNVFCIQDDRYDNLWVGTYGSGLFRFNIKNNNVSHYLYDRDNPNSIGDNMIWRIHEDRAGNLWIGTDKGGLNLYDYEKDQFIRFASDPNDSTSLSSNKILTIFEDSRGELWFGTSIGLNKLDISLNNLELNVKSESKLHFKHYTTHEGLPTNTIHAILEDDHNNLWISTNNGLSKFNPYTESFANYQVSDGLQDKEFGVNSSFKDTIAGELYFGGINGINVFHPDSIKYNNVTPEVVLTDFKILNQSISVNTNFHNRILLKKSLLKTEQIILSYKDIIFSISFSALHFNSPKSNQYAYMLEGFEKEWNYVDSDKRTATYTNLDPGEYIFRVKASNNDGVWNNEGTSLEIVITPPFWSLWWFRIIVILIVVTIVLISYKFRTYQIRKRNQELGLINTKLNNEIKKRHQTEKEIMVLNKQLEDRVNVRTRELESFAYSVSHDLRTPLRGIQGFSLTLLEEYENRLEDKGKEYLNRIVRATNHMAELIDDLLTLSRISRKELVIEKVNLSLIFEEIIKDLHQKNPERKVKTNVKNAIFATCDANLIKLAMENLIINAWKFSVKKPVTEIQFGKKNKKNETVFFIRDNGVGFNMKYADKLFEPFQRLHPEYEGTGIGLTTVQRIIQRHGGQIWAEGNENRGSSFYFTIPS